MLVPLLRRKYQCPYLYPPEVIVEFYGLTEFFNRSISDPVVRIAMVVFFDFSEFIQKYLNIGNKDMADGIALTIAQELFASESFLGDPQRAVNDALYELGNSKERFFQDKDFRARVNKTMKSLPKMDAYRFMDFKSIHNDPTGETTT